MPQKQFKSSKKHLTVNIHPFNAKVRVPHGMDILSAIKKANLPVKTSCGGKGTCGECVVRVLSGRYKSKPSAALSNDLIEQGYALACLTKITDDLTIQMPKFGELSVKTVTDSQYYFEHKDDISGVSEVDPIVKIIDLTLPAPTVDDNYSDLKRLTRKIRKELHVEHVDCEYAVIKKLAHAVRQNEGSIKAVIFNQETSWIIIDVVPDMEKKSIYGIVCDVGTTTVALQMVDLTNGKIVSTASSFNQQIKCGEDIISRINYASKPKHLKELQRLIIDTINNLISSEIISANISESDIYYASISGNTTMIHLLLSLDPSYIRQEPYVPTINGAPFVLSRELGLRMNEQGRVHCAPSVGSYVGGDITAGLLCTPILTGSEGISLFVDIGTNGELVIGNSDWLMSCACSAGPAFEGEGVKCGMPAAEGAIESVKFKRDGELQLKIIGAKKPRGVCGSGLIDLLAELLKHRYIDRNGTFNMERAGKRIVESDAGKGFLIAMAKKCYWGRDLIITENDIGNLIRTKAAVFSACSLLMKYLGITFDKVDFFYIAGGFGRQVNIENAIRIGLFPDSRRDKYIYLGNSSLLGAYLILMSDKNRELVDGIAEKMTYVELNTEPDYMNEYTGALFLPHTNIDLFPTIKKIFSG